MSSIQKVSIALTGEQITALKTAVDTGDYATTSEAVRDALRDWQHKRELRAEEVEGFRRLWKQGKASGKAVPVDLKSTRQEARLRLKKAVARAA